MWGLIRKIQNLTSVPDTLYLVSTIHAKKKIDLPSKKLGDIQSPMVIHDSVFPDMLDPQVVEIE